MLLSAECITISSTEICYH